MKKDFTLNINDRLLEVTIYGFENLGKKPAIFITHGFRGFKDWGFFPFAAEHLSKNNFIVFTFNFSGSGYNKELNNICGNNWFYENTYSREIEELNFLLGKYLNDYFGKVDNKKIHLVGFSRGFVSVAGNYYKFPEIASFCSWSGIAKIDRFSSRQKEEWKKNGYIYFLNNKNETYLKINTNLLTEIENESVKIEELLKNQNKPFMIIQGESDLIVTKKEAENLFEWSDKKNTKVEYIEKNGHFYNCSHPFESASEGLLKLLEHTENFFINNNNF